MELTEQTERFDLGYREGTPPWVIDEPQPAVVRLEGTGGFRGRVLDIGCGTGEHTAFLAGRGYEVLGADASPAALERARGRAEAGGVDARFVRVDALDPDGPVAEGGFDTILDSALFHVFDADRQARYADALRGLCEPGAVLHVLALARTDGPAFGPVISRSAIHTAFGRPGWQVEGILDTTYRGVVTEGQVEALGVPAGTRVDVPAWLARIDRVRHRPLGDTAARVPARG